MAETPVRNPRVQGRCPACNATTLFLGNGGHITCSWIDCEEPGAANRWLRNPQQMFAVINDALDAVLKGEV